MSGFTDKVTSVKMKYYDVLDIINKVDYSGSEQDHVKIRYNFNVDKGMLVRGLGVEEYDIFDGRLIRAVHYFRRYDKEKHLNTSLIIGVTTSGEVVYFYEDASLGEGVSVMEGVRAVDVPEFINYNFNGDDYLIINNGLHGMFVFDGKGVKTLVTPAVSNIAIFDNMLFGCSLENFANVKYTSLGTPDAWGSSMSGLRLYNECGMVQSLATIKSYLYVFQEHGITRISRYDGLDGSYQVSKMWYSGEKVIGSSVAVCGDDIYFCTHAGVYCFNGTTVRRVMTELDGFITPDDNARICYYNGKVYVTTKVSLVDEPFETESGLYRNNAVICYDPVSKRFDVYRGMSVSTFSPLPVGNVMLVAMDGYKLGKLKRNGTVYDKKLYKYIESTASNFGTGNKKTIHSVRIQNDVPLEFKLYVDGKTYYYEIPAGEMRYFRLNRQGYRIAFSLKALESECNISVPVFVYSEEVG